MDQQIVQMQEMLSHQGDEIEQLSAELKAQQREITALREQLIQLQARLEAQASEEGGIRPVEDETPPPHY